MKSEEASFARACATRVQGPFAPPAQCIPSAAIRAVECTSTITAILDPKRKSPTRPMCAIEGASAPCYSTHVADEREGEHGACRRAPDRATLDATVVQLKELERRSGLERTVAVGGLILGRFFDGSAKAWRERRRNKNNSVRRLAQHPSCPFSHSSLNQALGVDVTVRVLPCVQTFKHVGACHSKHSRVTSRRSPRWP